MDQAREFNRHRYFGNDAQAAQCLETIRLLVGRREDGVAMLPTCVSFMMRHYRETSMQGMTVDTW
jgi:hypothetical protein